MSCSIFLFIYHLFSFLLNRQNNYLFSLHQIAIIIIIIIIIVIIIIIIIIIIVIIITIINNIISLFKVDRIVEYW